ncbi:histidinol-phosphatase [Jannaschia seohaensis]|uniref:Histidinol-phosphatase n=1 Tax=Jannaschia seohaensis TaxID=475081 RepID=A0A2Y9AWT8_9RHOB|nr:histidinol-phosphatase [Jannaschia seohaensis]PWJ17008.1 histidinol phosphatase-like enzyme (inositol monophosphatase family) [Jannaschia seohaensis]SSA48345.1 histidinol-phosphatase, inositol monophosphatase family [Jannaschia seohaensis]
MRALDLHSLADVAHAVADAARAPALRYFRKPVTVDSKGAAFDPVTIADRETEAAMRAVLAERRPEDGILGEEEAAVDSRSGLTWVLDPIDGTRGYISGTPTWGVLVALRDASGPLIGIVDQPFTGERFTGSPDGATWTRGGETRRLTTRDVTRLDDATLFTTFPEVGTADEGAAFRRVAARCRLTRYGLDCYAYALLAAGQVDLVIEAGLQAYDIAAPAALITAAGGVVTNWRGGPAHDGGTVLAAATPELHADALALLNG